MKAADVTGFILISMFVCAYGHGDIMTDSEVNFEKTDFPKVTLSNGQIDVDVLLPDAQKGYYRGVRFDWSGIVDQVRYGKHTFLYSHDLNIYDSSFGVGTAEEFSPGICGLPGPLGYKEAKTGEGFIKIGVGVLEKSSQENYHFLLGKYKLLDPGVWSVRSGKNWIKFTQEIKYKHWGYRYTKHISLTENKPELIISRTLENIGIGTIETTHYSHNFMIFDREPIDANYLMRLPFEVKLIDGGLDNFGSVNNGRIGFHGVVRQSEKIWAAFEGFGDSVEDNCIAVENNKTKTGVRIIGNSPLRRFHLYVEPKMLCPEPFIYVIVEPNKQVNWQTTYLFSIFK